MRFRLSFCAFWVAALCFGVMLWVLSSPVHAQSPASADGVDVPPLPSIYAVPGSQGRHITLTADRFAGVTTPIHANFGPTSHDRSHTGVMMPADGASSYVYVFESIDPQMASSPWTSITTTVGATQTVELGRSQMALHKLTANAHQTVYSRDTLVQLETPPTAFAGDNYVIIMDMVALPVDPPPGHRAVTRSYSLRPSGSMTTETPMFLQMDYSPGALGEDDPHTLSIYRWDQNGDLWVDFESNPVSQRAAHSVATELFGSYVLMTGTRWRDTFGDYSGLEPTQVENMRLASGGRLGLREGYESGYAVSKVISASHPITGWGRLEYTAEITPGAALAVDVLAADGETVLMADARNGISLAAIDAEAHPAIRLRVEMAANDGGETPYLDDWKVTWNETAPITPPPPTFDNPVFLPLIQMQETAQKDGRAEGRFKMRGEARRFSGESRRPIKAVRGADRDIGPRPATHQLDAREDIAPFTAGDAPTVYPSSIMTTAGLDCAPPAQPPVEWSAHETLTNSDSFPIAPSAVADSAGTIHAVWYVGNTPNIYYTSKRDGDSEWTTPTVISAGSASTWYPEIAVDEEDNLHVIWNQNNAIHHTAKIAGGAWTEPTSLGNPSISGVGPHYDLTVGMDGNVHVVWAATDGVAYARRDAAGGAWRTPMIIATSTDSVLGPDIVTDSAGGVHVVWNRYQLYYIHKMANSPDWSAPVSLASTAGGTVWASLAIDADDHLHLVWQDRLPVGLQQYDFILYYASRPDGESWSTPTEITRTQVGATTNIQPTALAVGATGALYLVWASRIDYQLKYVIKPDREAGWSAPESITTLAMSIQPDNYFYVSTLAVGTRDSLHALWNGPSATSLFNHDIKYSAALPPTLPENHVLVMDGEGRALRSVCVFRDGELLGATDSFGILAPPDGVTAGQLVAVMPVADQPSVHREGWVYRTALTSLTQGANGDVSGHHATGAGRQILTIDDQRPFIYFNLVVSLQWNATEAYLNDLATAFQHASDYLFDVTDGQMALGAVIIYDDGAMWGQADVQILARNNVRPHAYIDGIRSPDPSDKLVIGRAWDGEEGASGPWWEKNGFRTIIHEFGHYALGLYDSYFGYEYDPANDTIITNKDFDVGCTELDYLEGSDARRASIMNRQYETSELSAYAEQAPYFELWDSNCIDTAHWQITEHQNRETGEFPRGESDWDTVERRYQDTEDPPRWQLVNPVATGVLVSGPDELPDQVLNLPLVAIHDGDGDVIPRQLTVLGTDGAPASESVLVSIDTQRLDFTLITIDQGLTAKETAGIELLGAKPGDTVRATALSGASTVEEVINGREVFSITLAPITGGPLHAADITLNPYVQLVPEDGNELLMVVKGVEAGGSLGSLIVSPGRWGSDYVGLSYSHSSGAYEGTFSSPAIQTGIGHAAVRGTAANGTQVNIDTDFALLAVETDAEVDLYTPDGNGWLHLSPGSFNTTSDINMALMPTGAVPQPLPDGAIAVGNAYSFRASGGHVTLEHPAVLRLFADQTQLPPGHDPQTLQLARWDGETWEILESEYNDVDHTVAGMINHTGIYVLLLPDAATPPPPLDEHVYLPNIRR